jgi:hypothetical protein
MTCILVHCVFPRAGAGETDDMSPVAATRQDASGVALVVARGAGDHLVHLAASSGRQTMCGQPIRVRPPQRSFRGAGCRCCLDAALDNGHVAAMEGDRSWINLRRMEAATT